MYRRAVMAGIAFCLLLGSLVAKENKPRYLATDAIDYKKLLTGPPAAGSDEARKEIDTLLELQKSRTDKQIDRVKSEFRINVFSFADVVGPWFTEKNCPQTARLFGQAATDADTFVKIAKNHWQRKRPAFMDPRIKPLSPNKDYSYPSGHATMGMLYAEILVELFPDKKEELLARGKQIGEDREIAGVHFPSDVKAGGILGSAVAKKLLDKPNFQEEMTRIKIELRKVRKAELVPAK